MANAVSEKSLVVLNYLKGIGDQNVTATDISEALGGEDAGFGKKSVDGIVTSGLQRKGLTERIPGTVPTKDENGYDTVKSVKYIKLTAKGAEYDHEAAKAQDAAEAAKPKTDEE